ncbi:hypothetical protein NPX13_g9033 [Xylaria arbuscula]|uniref:Uncharacterized protein n=1 Tax=Xylaria arbuscula TaxID=114810 RepID=A0A9W8TJ98_9PEZI|nr:hypothetical protein NPX13_g9033 [Xylaria arbuscula]
MAENSATGSGSSKDGQLVSDNPAMPSNGETVAQAIGEVDSPTSPSSANALARFEFETGRGNDGSKILMVEWDCSHPDGREICGEDRTAWTISWEDKSAAYAISDNDKSPSSLLRVYHLLPETASIPPTVTITQSSTGRTLTAKCMPAIFAPGLGKASSRDSRGNQ